MPELPLSVEPLNIWPLRSSKVSLIPLKVFFLLTFLGEEYTKAIDWWSVGTIIFEMLTGLPPFYTEDEENMYTKIMTADLEFPPYLSYEVTDLISKFLRRDPNQRLQNAAEIK